VNARLNVHMHTIPLLNETFSGAQRVLLSSQ
jgi:hypothetical protein